MAANTTKYVYVIREQSLTDNLPGQWVPLAVADSIDGAKEALIKEAATEGDPLTITNVDPKKNRDWLTPWVIAPGIGENVYLRWDIVKIKKVG